MCAAILQSPFVPSALAGFVCFITGGGTGICFGIAQVLGRHGAKLALMGRRQQVLDEACAKLKADKIEAIGISGDVRDFKSAQNAIDTTVKHFGKLDVLINGAAGNFLCAAEDLSSNAFQTVIGIDLLGTFNMCKAAFPSLVASKGSIINISATLHYGATFYQTHAAAAKAGVDSLTRTLALEWGKYLIRINGVAPGPISDTEGMKRLGAGVPEEHVSAQVPLGRLGRSDEIGYACLFLVLPIAGYISGETLVVDGGSWLQRRQNITHELYEAISAERKLQKKPQARL